MKNALLILFALMTLCYVSHAQEKKKNLIWNSNDFDKLTGIVVSAAEWHPFPSIKEREKWDAIDAQTKSNLIGEGEKYLNYKWKIIPASIALDYKRNGNRSRYESLTHDRRSALASLLFAELVENKGRFMDDIANGIWLTCEESFWGASAHLSAQKVGIGLPDVTDPVVDLFSAETSSLLSWTYYLLGEKLDLVSPLIRPRIKLEIERRIFKPYLGRNYSWMGFDSKPNNWNAWINSNMLISTLIMQDDQTERTELIKKIIITLNNFISQYPADGGCDEGPSYWKQAGGRFFASLDFLYRCTNGKINIYDNQLIKNIGAYIYKMHIAGYYYFNTGDSPAIVNMDPAHIFYIGKNINDKQLMSLGAYLKKQKPGPSEESYYHPPMFLRLSDLFENKEIDNYEGKEILLRDFYLPQSQYAGARSTEGKRDGLYFAMQGGHNGESHNHNDVGNFVVYVNGQPAVIDVGVEVYSAKTFSADRYSIWNMQSDYHNLPNINGFMQKAGSAFKATDISYTENDLSAEMKMDISKAYPAEAKIDKWFRSVKLNRNKNIELTENYKLGEFIAPVKFNFMTCLKPDVSESGIIKLKSTERFKKADLYLRYDTNNFSPSVEKIKIEDARLLRVWGDLIYRVTLISKEKKTEGNIKFLFSEK